MDQRRNVNPPTTPAATIITVTTPAADPQLQQQQLVEEYEEGQDESMQQFEEGNSADQQYYEEYVVDNDGGEDPNAVYYEQVIEEKPTPLRPAGATLSAIGNAGGFFGTRSAQQTPIGASALPLRPFAQGLSFPPRSRMASSMVYTPPSLATIKREAGSGSSSHPFAANFFKSQQKPAKRKASGKRKPCNCTKSMCLKLYCDCFANGEFCLDCNCKDCHNNLDHEAERSRAIKSSLERNPSAFKPKIGVAAKAAAGKALDMERLHQKGCHCKKSNCLKNYCECYEAKVPCTDRCKCQSCRNTEHDRHNKFKDKFSTTAGGLAQLAAAAAADSRTRSGSVGSNFGGSDVLAENDDQRASSNPKTQPWFYMNEDVIETTTMCLVSQAQEFEHTLTEEELEKSVLKEFGRCLEQIIESATSFLPQQIQAQQSAAAAAVASPTAPSTSTAHRME